MVFSLSFSTHRCDNKSIIDLGVIYGVNNNLLVMFFFHKEEKIKVKIDAGLCIFRGEHNIVAC